jgi:hypothetical protein
MKIREEKLSSIFSLGVIEHLRLVAEISLAERLLQVQQSVNGDRSAADSRG